ncbi:MAG TPA: hypothetical protein VMZ22_13205 [Acidimicrobiales bacterium]|nr:hypothetical protein [Acidimicrobiales bacterium]
MTLPDSPVPKDDWITQLLDKLDELIETVRSKTTEPVAKIARYLVYLVLFAVVGVALLALTLVLVVRLLAIVPGPLWWGYAGIAVISLLLGTFLWRKAVRATR